MNQRLQTYWILSGLLLALTACTATPSNKPASVAQASNRDATPTMAILQGQTLGQGELWPMLAEAAGGQVLLEYVMDAGLQARLAQRNLSISDQQVQAEQEMFVQTMGSDADQAQRALNQIREQRGLGEVRYRQLLWRNAALRALVEPTGPVTDAALQQAFEQRYGPRYETRLIVAPTLSKATEMVRRAEAGESFIDLAINHSIDSSKSQGGLLPPMNLQDATFPAAVRQAVSQLEVGQVSDPVALDSGFAVLKLERKIQGAGLKLTDVKEELETRVTRQMQQMLMQRLAREVVLQSDLVIMDPALSKSYAQAKAALLGGN